MMSQAELNTIAIQMTEKGKGILAADESTSTISKRFDGISLSSTFENRRDWRELLFQAENAMKNYISGVILYDETLRQSSKDPCTSLPDLIKNHGVIVGIKVDTGAKPLANSLNETITEGLDGLRERLSEYYQLGARFAKWRAVIKIDQNTLPSIQAIKANTHALARYAALCQEVKIVPIVEPEILMDGNHTIDRCYDVTQAVLKQLYQDLNEHHVFLEGSVLKPNMVISGTKCPDQAEAEEIAEKTVYCLKSSVPEAVAGIAFLSGGQSDIQATKHLNLMNQLYPDLAWNLTFSYGRALQAAPLKAWYGKEQNIEKAQSVFEHRAFMNSLASLGKWSSEKENNTFTT